MKRRVFLLLGLIVLLPLTISANPCRRAMSRDEVAKIKKNTPAPEIDLVFALQNLGSEVRKAELKKKTELELVRMALVLDNPDYTENFQNHVKTGTQMSDAWQERAEFRLEIFEELSQVSRKFDRVAMFKEIFPLVYADMKGGMPDYILGYQLRTIDRKVAQSQERFGKEKIWQEEGGMFQTPWRELFEYMRRLDLKPGQTVVDLGCGYGRLGILIGLFYPEVKFVGYEIVPERIAEAKRVQKLLGISEDRVQFQVVDMSRDDFLPVSADVYYAAYPVGGETGWKITLDLKKISKSKDFRILFNYGVMEGFESSTWAVPVSGWNGAVYLAGPSLNRVND